MKTMNHVPSTSEGTVKSILVKDGQPVEFGQTLILLK
jgi:acetyl-CoA carboxylase biotin carboxyl carrier protein